MKSVESDDESGTMYAIIHMNAMATSGLQASDLYKQSTSLTFEFSLLEKSEYLEQWDIEILTDNKSLNRNQDLKIYIKNKKNFFKKIYDMFSDQYLEYREEEMKNRNHSETARYSVMKIPFTYNEFKDSNKNYLEICYDDAEFIYGLTTKESCGDFINQNIINNQ